MVGREAAGESSYAIDLELLRSILISGHSSSDFDCQHASTQCLQWPISIFSSSLERWAMQTKRPAKIAEREIDFSNLDKIMYPAVGFTKRQVIDYYIRVSPFILPHIKNRPVTLKRFPDGVGGEHFYEKDAPSYTPRWIKTFPIARTSKAAVIHYILINDLPTLAWSANMANLEIHPFLAKAPHIDMPTTVVFDLDPGDGADILNSCEVAFLVKDLLDRLNLKSFVKVSGSKGIHLHVPLNTKVTYEATQPFAKSIAQLLESEHPDLIVSEMAKTRRKGKVFVD